MKNSEHVTRQRLLEVGITFKGNDRSLVFVRSNHVLDKNTGGGLFIRKRSLFGNADVDQKGDRERPVSLTLEREKLLRNAILNYANVDFLQISDVVVVFVGGGEEKIGEVALNAKYLDVGRR